MALQQAPATRVQMLIRKPVAEVFEAFVDPSITSKFWFTHSTGRLEPGKEVRWDWEMYGVSAPVSVKAVEPGTRILVEWPDAKGKPCPVEWTFTPRGSEATLVSISNWGFSGTEDEAVAQAIDSTGGFAMVLAGVKALLEHGVVLNLVGDQFPDAHVK